MGAYRILLKFYLKFVPQGIKFCIMHYAKNKEQENWEILDQKKREHEMRE